jgi:hypothetical protein
MNSLSSLFEDRDLFDESDEPNPFKSSEKIPLYFLKGTRFISRRCLVTDKVAWWSRNTLTGSTVTFEQVFDSCDKETQEKLIYYFDELLYEGKTN